MRISDWSSDVCSSDLEDAFLEKAAREGHRRGGGDGEQQIVDSQPIVVEEVGEGPGERARGGEGIGRKRADHRAIGKLEAMPQRPQQREVIDEQRDAEAAESGIECHTRQVRWRSEGHTSQLYYKMP